MAAHILSEIFYHEEYFIHNLSALLITCILNNPEPHHNHWPPTCSILDLRPILRFPLHFYKHQQTQIDPMTTLSIPTRYWLTSTYEIRRREELCTIPIKISNKVFKKIPPINLMDFTFTSHIWLLDPPNIPPQHIETVPIHAGLSKFRCRPVLWLIDSRT